MQNQKNYTPVVVVIIIVVLLFLILVFLRLNNNNQQGLSTDLSTLGNEVSPSADLSVSPEEAKLIYYSKNNCEYCTQVKDYLNTQPQLWQQIGIIEKNTDHLQYSAQFSQDLAEKAQICGLDTSAIGLPMMYIDDETLPATERCLMGSNFILDYFAPFVQASSSTATPAADFVLE